MKHRSPEGRAAGSADGNAVPWSKGALGVGRA
jgi:hypothetical protein